MSRHGTNENEDLHVQEQITGTICTYICMGVFTGTPKQHKKLQENFVLLVTQILTSLGLSSTPFTD